MILALIAIPTFAGARRLLRAGRGSRARCWSRPLPRTPR